MEKGRESFRMIVDQEGNPEEERLLSDRGGKDQGS